MVRLLLDAKANPNARCSDGGTPLKMAIEAEMQVDLRRSMGFVPADGGTNQIGNLEDGPVVPDNVHGGASAVEIDE